MYGIWLYCAPPVVSLWLLCMQSIFFDRFQRFSVDSFSAVRCDFDVSIRRGKLMSYSTTLSQWYVSAHCYNLYYCLKLALITSLENSMDCIVHGLTESDTTEQLSLSPSPIFHQKAGSLYIHRMLWYAAQITVSRRKYSVLHPPGALDGNAL